MNYYQIAWFFVIYAFLGWCSEVAFATLKTGKFVNRGFLSGPVCPIYGFGVSIVIVLLTPLKENLLILFLGSVILTSLLEYVTGLVLEKVFGDKWWDYSNEPFNIHGYICLRFSILWGLACILIVDCIHPYIARLVNWLPHTVGLILLLAVLAAFLADAGVTIDGMLKLKKKLKLMHEISDKLKVLSDDMGQDISTGVSNIVKAGKTVKEDLAEYKANAEQQRMEARQKKAQSIAALQAKYDELLKKHSFTQRHLLKAFPHLQQGHHGEIIEKWKESWQNKKK